MTYMHTWQVHHVARRERNKRLESPTKVKPLVCQFYTFMNNIEGIGRKCGMSVLVSHLKNHEVLGKIIIGYSRSTLS